MQPLRGFLACEVPALYVIIGHQVNEFIRLAPLRFRSFSRSEPIAPNSSDKIETKKKDDSIVSGTRVLGHHRSIKPKLLSGSNVHFNNPVGNKINGPLTVISNMCAIAFSLI
jgi:hypothetical protein